MCAQPNIQRSTVARPTTPPSSSQLHGDVTTDSVDPMEYERDKHGRYILDPFWGYKLTARAEAIQRRKYEDYVKSRPPYRILPDIYTPVVGDIPGETKPLLRWGIAFTEDQMLDCARRNHLMDETKRNAQIYALFRVILFLQAKCGMILEHVNPVATGRKHVASLYSNFSMFTTMSSQAREKKVFAILRQELRTEEEAKWWWDSDSDVMGETWPVADDCFL
ncbi:hypothetical protein BV25DRAFT_1826158 [Artomyces pyxidatus]|uniref:Uncharacterized protein n=1 Tax=Artomyces pyxidatus TaxID=48021 RepID=A0ACB8T159_9AGAM|nr:hypothetical protein BV25DRAFT_1826158 [Artomyces pyxidatus]